MWQDTLQILPRRLIDSQEHKMIIAKISLEGNVMIVGKPGDLFPNIAFPSTGPNQEFLEQNSCLEVSVWKPHNKETEKLVSCEPYIEGDTVFTVEVIAKTQEEIDAEIALKNEKLQKEIVDSTQFRLDQFARTKNYDGILSACTYATDPSPTFSAEGQRCVDLRSNTWSTLYTILAEVQAGTRPIPSGYADIEPDLPSLTWE